MEEKQFDLRMSGVGTAAGGKYGVVLVQGVGRIHGDIECSDCTIEGLAQVAGNIRAKTMNIQGKSTVKGNVTGDEITVEGQLTIAGNCTAERFTVGGAVSVDGLLNAGEISIRLEGPVRVGEIGGGNIRVRKSGGFRIFHRWRRLSTDVIEGDEIHLENTKANVVRGNRVTIGPGCEIGRVEYQTEYQKHKTAKVIENEKV